MTTLFPEIIDNVIDHLHDDKLTLSRCSLVSQSWLPCSRFHLFQAISIYQRHEGSNLVNGFDQFQAFLDDAPPSITSTIRELTLAGRSKTEIGTRWPIVDTPEAALHVVLSIACKLPWLRTLRIKRLRLNVYEGVVPIPSNNQVAKLSMYCVNLQSSFPRVIMGDLLRSFSDLRELTLSSMRGWWDFAEVRNPGSEWLINGLKFQLKSFAISQNVTASGGFLTELRQGGCFQRLKHLKLCYFVLSDAAAIGAILKETGATLQSLEMEIPHSNTDLYIPIHAIDFTPCTALESVYLRMNARDLGECLNATTHILSQVTPSLTHLTIVMRFNRQFPYFSKTIRESVNWERMALVLSRFKRLEELVYRLKHLRPSDENEAEAVSPDKYIKDQLAPLDAKGILKVSVELKEQSSC